MANLNVNQSFIGGRLTADPDLKATTDGIPICTFTIATARKAKRDKTDFIPCVAWRSMAEHISRYFRKGSSIFIRGNIQTRSWEDEDGKKRYATEVVIEETSFVDSKSEAQEIQGAATPSFDSLDGFIPIQDDELPF